MRSEGLTAAKRVSPGALEQMLRGCTESAELSDVHESLAVLSRSHVQRRDCARLVVLLLSIAEDHAVHPMIRGGAAEAVSVWLLPTLRSLRRQAITRLVVLLRDETPDVRFWSAFSLGQLRATQARPALRRLLVDRRVIEGWWPIADEATAALESLERRPNRSISVVSPAREEATRTNQT